MATLGALSYDLSAARYPFLFKAVMLYVVIALVVRSRERVIQFVKVNIVFTAIVSITTVLTMRAGISPLGGGDLYRMVNYFGGIGDDPNEFGAFMLAQLPLPLLLMSTEKSKVKKVFLALVTLAVLLCIIRTRSRGAFLGMLVIGPVLLWSIRRRFGHICLAISMLAYAYMNTHVGYWERIATTFSQEAIEEDFSATARLQEQGAARALVMKRPLLGVGPGNFVIGKIQLLGYDAQDRWTWVAPHNAYFGLAAEIGIPGLLVLLVAIVMTLRALGQAAKSGGPDDEHLRLTARALRIGLVGFLVAIFFLSEQYNPVLYMWMGLGAALRAILLPVEAAAPQRARRPSTLQMVPQTR
jgi:O-antigen ligase